MKKPDPTARCDRPEVQSRFLRMLRDDRGSTIVEAAFILPMVIALLLGAISYGVWFMAAHSLQQAANDAARASLAALDADERDEIVAEVIADGVLGQGTVDPSHVTFETSLDQNLFTVEVSYDTSDSLVLSNSLIPLPGDTITRVATVRLSSL